MPLPEQASSEQTLEKEHPAIQAWLRLWPGSSESGEVMLLTETGKSAVYKLNGLGPHGTDIVAKRCNPRTGYLESVIYNEILCRLPMPSLRCYGFLEDHDGALGWLFLEDGGTTGIADQNESLGAALACWLGTLHTSASSLVSLGHLPDRGPAFFLVTLRCARERLRKSFPHLEASSEDWKVLEGLLACLDALEAAWHRIVERCETLPWTLVHCDLRSKNILMRPAPGGIAFLPLDWEFAGWGPPAADLDGIDCYSYWASIRKMWPGVELRCIEEQACCGTLFQLLAAVGWEMERLVSGAAERAVRRLRIYAPSMSASTLALGVKVKANA